MRIYEVKKYGKAIGFARSFDQAKVVVREDDPNAKKNCSYDQVTEYTNGVEVFSIDIKPDKEGIINKLNSLLEEKPSQPEQVEQEQVAEPEEVVSRPEPERFNVGGISPAIEYKGKGQGTCLHCNKTVGYVGGFPRVNPPKEIRDKGEQYE